MRNVGAAAMTTRSMMAMALCAAAFAPAPAGAQDQPITGTITLEPVPTAAKITVTGLVAITAVLDASAQVPDGATVSFNANASAYDGSYTNNHSISGSATVAARKATLSIRLPYTWVIEAMTTKMNVSLFVRTRVSSPGKPTYDFTTSFNSVVNMPASGATTRLTYSGSL